MKSLKLLPIIILLCCSAVVQATTNPEDIRLSFPFFQSGQSSGIRDELMVGYGDWCCESAHRVRSCISAFVPIYCNNI